MSKVILGRGTGVLALAAALSVPSAFAADVLEPIDIPSGDAAPAIAGYVDVFAGKGVGGEEIFFWGNPYLESDWELFNFGGAGRVAIPWDSAVIQLDAWANASRYNGDTCWAAGGCYNDWELTSLDNPNDAVGPDAGVAAHLAWMLDGAQLGGMVSLGKQGDFGAYATGALEAAANFDSVRIYGQVGYTQGLTDTAEAVNDTALYAHGVLAYYLDPNTSISANLGAALEHDDWEEETVFRWGARLEHRWDEIPLSTYIAYQGQSWDGATTDLVFDDWTWNGMNHAVYVGVRVAFGSESLQDLDRKAGLMDLNPLYGDPLPH